MGGSAMEPFFNLGLWRNVRLEFVPEYKGGKTKCVKTY